MSITPTGTSLGRTLGDWCDELHREYLERKDRTPLEELNGAVTTGATLITVSHGSTLRSQVAVEIDDELLHVWGDGSAAQSFVVRRGHAGSTAVQHSDGALVRVGPRFPRITLAKQLRREVRSWPVAIYAVAVGEFDIAADTEAFDLDGLSGYELFRVLRVQQDHPTEANATWPEISHVLERRQNTTDFPSGYALRLPVVPGTARTIRVTVGYRHPVPASLDFTADLGTTWHLNDTLADAAMLGVAGRLLATGETDRTDDRSQARPRRAEEVPPGHNLQAGQALFAERDRLLALEAERLLTQYGYRF